MQLASLPLVILTFILFRVHLERTKNRPLASGYISVTSAVVFLFVLLLPCIGLLGFTDSFTQAFIHS